LRLGMDMGILSGAERGRVQELLLAIQPAHLQRRAGRTLQPPERDQARAELVRETLGPVIRVALRARRKKHE